MTANPNPIRRPYINLVDIDKNSDGPLSPFHAMEDHDEGQGQGSIAMVPVSTISRSYDELDEEGNSLKVHQGHADFDAFDAELQFSQISNSKWYFGKTKRAAVKVLYMTVFAVLGSLIRMMMAQLFGEECKNPGTVGWLSAGQPLCVTANGETTLEGGIVFADLPANLLGSFIMGLMQTTATMDLPKSFPIAFLSEDSVFQTMDIIHLAIRTGFCGSLTTFSSWNSEMIVIILGVNFDRGSSLFRGLFGYLIGVETALASFVLGKNMAKYIHSAVNKPLQVEASEALKKKECGVYINSQLSDYERRFLSEFDMGEYEIDIDPVAMQQLSIWRNSTRENRRVGNHLLPLLTDIEYQTLVQDEDIDQDVLVTAMMAKWDLDALNRWREMKRCLDIKVKVIEPKEMRFAPAFRCALLVMSLLVAGLVLINAEDNYSVTYRTMVYIALFAPFGALLRWHISQWNGKWKRFGWFPLGTFAANLLACIISALMIGVEYRMNGSQNFWQIGTVHAIKVGFAGCLSTVSTFINEFSTLLSSPHPIRGYMYVFISLFSCGLAGGICFFSLTYHENAGTGEYYYNG